MTRNLLLYRCPACETWGDFRNDTECKCGFHVYEVGDPMNEGELVEIIQIDIHKTILFAKDYGFLDDVIT
ncbi:MAG: hypothetical protein ACXADF_14995 [Candidatus Thorarchaeota archaeon]|jgi:hypothetical protein